MSEGVPFITIVADALDGQPTVRPGALILCGRCTGTHTLTVAYEGTTEALLFYRCRYRNYVGAVDGQLWPGLKLAPGGGHQ